MTTPHDKAIEAVAGKLRSPTTFPGNTATLVARELISAYLSSIGGVVCAREPAAWFWKGPKGGFLADDKKPSWSSSPLHAPISEAGSGDGHPRNSNPVVSQNSPSVEDNGDGWLPIETAPKDGKNILAFYKNWSEPEIVAWNEGENAWCNGSWCWNEPPTHWRLLPAPPTVRSEDREGRK